MKHILYAIIFLSISFSLNAQTICNPNGNVVLYSNYDGGVLNINVDVNIPNLKIGIVSYEMVTINLSGPFVNNVTAVQFAGYTTTTHQHCNNSPSVTSITGAPAGTDTIIYTPNSPVTNPNGYYIIICNTSCDTSNNQGGCNTPDQVAAYFQQQFGGALRYHLTQYGCWTGSYDLSSGGNCCVGAVASVPSPVSLFQSSDTTFCEKKCIDFTDLSTNNPTSWQWFFPGADSTSSNVQNPTGICYSSYGSFDVTLIACNAFGCDTLLMPGFINEFQSPPVPVVTANADTLFSSDGHSYQWYDSSGAIPAAVNSFFVYQQQGAYYVIVTDSNGCESSSQVIYTGIQQISGSFGDLTIFPNPSDGGLEIIYNDLIHRDLNVEVFDIDGRVIFKSIITNEHRTINLSGINSGLYILKVSFDKEIRNYKIVVNGSR